MSYYMEFGGVINGFFTRNKQVCLDDLQMRDAMANSFRAQTNNTDVYYCTYLYDNPSDRKNSHFYSPLYFDIDADHFDEDTFGIARYDTRKLVNYLKTWYRLTEEDIQIYFSGAKGFHIIIAPEVLGIRPDNLLNIVYGGIVKDISKTLNIDTIDTRIYDNKRLLRMVNSINSKTGLYKVLLTHQMMETFSYEALREYAQSPKYMQQPVPKLNLFAMDELKTKLQRLSKERERIVNAKVKPVVIPEQKQGLLPCVRYLLQTPIYQGGRNNVLVALASSLLQSGWKNEEAKEVLLEWNQNNAPPLSEYEIDRTLKSANDMLHDGRKYGCGAYADLLSQNTCCKDCQMKANRFRASRKGRKTL